MFDIMLLVLAALVAGNTLWSFIRTLPPEGEARDQAFARYVKIRLWGALAALVVFVILVRDPLWLGPAIVGIWLAITVGGGWIAYRRVGRNY